MAHQIQHVVLRLDGRHQDLLGWKRDVYVLAINWIYLLCETEGFYYSMPCPLAMSQANC